MVYKIIYKSGYALLNGCKTFEVKDNTFIDIPSECKTFEGKGNTSRHWGLDIFNSFIYILMVSEYRQCVSLYKTNSFNALRRWKLVIWLT